MSVNPGKIQRGCVSGTIIGQGQVVSRVSARIPFVYIRSRLRPARTDIFCSVFSLEFSSVFRLADQNKRGEEEMYEPDNKC